MRPSSRLLFQKRKLLSLRAIKTKKKKRRFSLVYDKSTKPPLFLLKMRALLCLPASASRSSTAVKIRHAYIRRSVQLESVYQNIDDAPEAHHHEQADDAVNHHVFHFSPFFFIVSRRDIFQNSVEEKNHRESD